MPTILIRWALPHKGCCTHLTGFEYRLRVLVFGLLWVAAFLPTVFIIVCVAFGAIPAILIFVGFSGMLTGEFIGFKHGEVELMVVLAVGWCFSFMLCKFLEHRYLTPR